jgi:hypothetical protein
MEGEGTITPLTTLRTDATALRRLDAHAAVRVAVNLDDSAFPVQGPPVAGKTYTAHDLRACARRQARSRQTVTKSSVAFSTRSLPQPATKTCRSIVFGRLTIKTMRITYRPTVRKEVAGLRFPHGFPGLSSAVARSWRPQPALILVATLSVRLHSARAANGCFWRKAAVRRNVRCWVNNGKHMLALRFSAFDPPETLAVSGARALDAGFSPY